jgi:hypothetical protein
LNGPFGIDVLPLQLVSTVSRKTHGLTDFDINLPLAGAPGVECRSSGGNHTLVFTFNNNVVSGSASVTTGIGSVSGSPAFAGNAMTVNLTGVTDVQKITVTLSGVTDNLSQVLPDTEVSVNMLIGDVNASRRTDAGDVTLVRQQTPSTPASLPTWDFRRDVNADARIDAGDVTLVRQHTPSAIGP